MTDYSRFYLVGSNLIGHQLCCLDCDEDDRLPWLNEDPTLDLGEMVRMADAHVADRHPGGQPEAEADGAAPIAEWQAAEESLSLWGRGNRPDSETLRRFSRAPQYSGVLGYLEAR